MSSQKTGKRRRPPLSLPPWPRGRSTGVEGMQPPPPRRPRTHDGARDQGGAGPAGAGEDSASPESAPGSMDHDDEYVYPEADGEGDDDDDNMNLAVEQPAGPIQGRAAEEDARQQELARVMAESRRDAWSNENASSGGAAETSHNQGSSSSRGASGEDTPDSDSHVQLSDGDEDFESDSRSAGRTPVSKRRKREPEVAPSVWTVPGDNTRGFVGRYNPAGGDCGPYSIGQVASSETPSPDELRGYREAGVQHVLDHPITFSIDSWLGDTPEERASNRDDWAEKMRQPEEWADYRLMLGMRAVYCRDAIIVEPAFPGDPSNRELSAYGQDVLDASKPMIMIQGDIHFLVLDEVGRGWNGGSGDGDALDPSSSSGDTDGDGSSSSSGSGSGSGKSRSRSSSSGSRSRSRSRSRSSSSSGGGSSSGGSGSGGGGAFSPAQAAAMESLERDAAWFLRIEDRKVSPAERQKARRLLENPRELHGLRNEALKNPQVYRGTRSCEDLDRHQLRDLVGAALLPENGLSRILGFFKGDLLALESACDEAELQGPVGFSKFLRDRGIDAPVNTDHPAFAGDPAAWTHPILLKQGMCLQYQKLPFWHNQKTTATGKASAAADKVSSFEGGPAGYANRLGASCVKVVADRPESSVSAIPHCAALSQLRPELRQVTGVVERSWAQSFLHYFRETPGVGVFRGGDIAQAGCGRDTVRELASVGGRKAFVYHGRHQSKAIGDPEALESAGRGDLELYRACTNGEAVTDAHVGEMMVDILMEAIEIHAEANGGEPTDNDIRRRDELEEARDQGLPRIREVAGRIGKELRGKHVRTRADCRAGATAPLKPTTAAQSAYQRMVSAGKTPTRQGVNFTGPEKKRTKSTNELKGDGGKGTQGHNITSSGGSRGARTGREPINDSSVMVSIGLFRRAYKITVGENKGEVKISKRRSKFYRFRDVRGTDSNKWIVGKRRFDSNGSDKTLSYPADDEGNMVTGKEWDADPEKGLYHDHLVTYARDYLQKRG